MLDRDPNHEPNHDPNREPHPVEECIAAAAPGLLACLLEQHDIAAHDVVDAFALYLDDDAFAAAKDSRMRLRNGSAAQRMLIEGRKDFAHRAPVGAFDDGNDL